MSSAAVLIVPACETGLGGGHLKRCLFLLRALEEKGKETYIWIAERHKDTVFLRFREFFEGSDFAKGFHARLLSRKKELTGIDWDFIVLDRFRTPADEFAFWYDLGPLVGIDEGGPCRARFDFLIDLLPALDGPEANASVPGLLPMPRTRRPPDASLSAPPRVLISFGAEDAAGLGFLAARAAARNLAGKSAAAELTLIAPGWDYAGKKQRELAGIKVIGTLPNLKEQLAEYDLFVTHFGIGAFEAVYARVPVLLVSPTDYHEKLSLNAGFLSLGVGAKAAERLGSLALGNEFLKTLSARGAKLARRFGLEGEQKEDLGSFLGRIAPRSPRHCPLCGEKAPARPVLARFGEETYRRCVHCGVIHLSRLKPPAIEYGKDYFFEFYKKQYGKTYLEDFPNLVEMGIMRMEKIEEILTTNQHKPTRTKRGWRSGGSCRSSGSWLNKKKPRPDSAPKPRLLDIGCAYGPFLAAAAECGFSPSGVDPVQDAVRYVKEELGFPAWQGFFPTGAKAEDGPFDAVTLWYVIEHFDEPGKVLAEIHRLLRDGGVLAFSTPSFAGISGRKDLRAFLKNSPADHWTVWSPRSCKRVLKRYGFSLRKIAVTGHHPERFPLVGRFVGDGKKGLLYRLLLFASRLFRLGDTFEAYAVKVTNQA
ncbi:MAG: class I SAM-dependent methyltransferase [Treponema sp.]|nr:class I SAM-dependent methyltransferase [Treponema sp.]